MENYKKADVKINLKPDSIVSFVTHVNYVLVYKHLKN